MKKILIFGITGSIGQQAYDIINQQNDLELVGFSFGNNINLATKIYNSNSNLFVYSKLNQKLNNVNSYEQLIKMTSPDLILNSVIGFDGLEITKLAMKYKIDLALANKESLVAAGKFILDFKKNNCDWKLYPVDSEHSSIYYLLNNNFDRVKTIYITASGGPFYNLSIEEISNKKYSDAINHLTWQMGDKISIDSANLINKCFEMIEAHFLFKNIDIIPIYHPQSIVHAMIELVDNSIIANMSFPCMKIPISLSLNDFKAQEIYNVKKINFSNLTLNFDYISPNKWLPIKWANEVMKSNNFAIGIIIVVLDDYLINLFRQEKIKFIDIVKIIDFYIEKYKTYKINDWNDIYLLKSIIEDEFFNSMR